MLALAVTAGCAYTGAQKTGPGRGAGPPALVLAENGVALAVIATGRKPIPAEKTAVTELVDHLARITGATFEVVPEEQVPAEGKAVYVGDTAFARARGVKVGDLGDEESVLRTAEGNLILAGGRPRGTLYAVCIFLEDVLGCRWYTGQVERIPQLSVCAIPALGRRSRPAFWLRSDYTRLPERSWSDQEKDAWRRYLIRNRVNGPEVGHSTYWRHRGPNVPELIPGGDAYGGCAGLRHGGPHTFARHFPEKEYFDEHPEWHSERGGKRVPSNGHDGNHLCLVNPDLRRTYVEKLKGHMTENPDTPLFSVAMNDGGNARSCECRECLPFAERSSWTDLYLDFLNELADGVRDDFPDKLIWTIAYSFAARPPKSVKPRDNIMVMACLLNSNHVTVPECAEGKPFSMGQLSAWAEACGKLQVWDYVEWGPPYHSLSPVYWRMQKQYQFCRDIGVVGVFAENEVSASRFTMSEFYPMRVWLFAKLVEDPDRDLLALIRDFMEGYYGKAGPFLYQYIEMQHKRLALWPHRMVDLEFVNTMQRLYDQAEAATRDEAEVHARVKDARIWADVTTLLFKNKLADEFVRNGGRMEQYPYKSGTLKDRLVQQLEATADPFWAACYPVPYPRGPRLRLSKLTRDYVEALALGADYAPLPERFRSLPPDRVVSIPGYQMKHCQKAELVKDPDSVFGVVSARLTAEEMPVGMGVYDYTKGERGEPVLGRSITAKDVPGKGYHVYELGRTTLSPQCRFWFTKSWQIQQQLSMFHDPMNMTEEWDVYASVKVDGPDYPHGDANGRNGAYVERLILVRVEK